MPSRKRMTARQAGCLRRYGGGPRTLASLVCFPWAGGGASAYRRIATHMPEAVEFMAVQYPGREDRFDEDRLVRMDSLVKHLVADILPIFSRPLIFFGHSMGALVAYEVAQALKHRTGREPRMLIVSGSGSPDNEGSYERCPGDADEEDLIANMQQLGGTPPEILANRNMVRAILPVLRADYEILDNYVPSAAGPLSCPMIACAGDEDPSVSPASLQAWRHCSSGPYQEHWFAGDHFYLSVKSQELARTLLEWIIPRDEQCVNQ